jgi:shikimate kinase
LKNLVEIALRRLNGILSHIWLIFVLSKMPHVILIGPPGAGKSSVGKALAQRLSLGFADTDALIEKESGMRVSDIFLDKGEPFFRELEQEIVLRSLAAFDGVLALGGGAVMNSEVEQALRDSSDPIYFLDVSLSSAAPRIGFNRDRPLLVGNPRAKWQELMNIRRPIYEALATHTVSTDSGTPSQIAQQIADAFSKGEEVNS